MKQLYTIIFGIMIGLLAAGLILLISKPDQGQPITLNPAPTPTTTSQPKPTNTETPFRVQISGEIIHPGIYEIPPYSRLETLVQIAGGLTEGADVNRVNLALLLDDGDYVFIPEENQDIPDIARNAPINSLISSENTFSYPININTATQEEFESLPGIGPTKAADIIEYRQKIGAFSSIEELVDIHGIGPVTLENLREYLICEP
mgnify:CR=1 FL=1